MKIVDKNLLDELIRLTKKYWYKAITSRMRRFTLQAWNYTVESTNTP